jgi:hypothetical protein
MNDFRAFTYAVAFFGALVAAFRLSNENGTVSVVVAAVAVGLLALGWRNLDPAEQRRRDLEHVRSGMADIDLIAGVEFEKYIAARLRQAGWSVSMTRQPVTTASISSLGKTAST